MFKTVLVIYYLTGHINVVRSEVWLQNGQRSNPSITAARNQSTASSVNIADTVTAVLINVDSPGAPRSLNATNSRSSTKHNSHALLSELRSTIANRRTAASAKILKRSQENLRLVYQSTSSNPKNDVEVFRPLEGGAPPGYAPRAPQPPSFPPSLPDYPSGLYPYEPPYYYPVYSNDIPSFPPYYPPVFMSDPVYPTSAPPTRQPPPPNYPDYATAMRTHETEPTTPSTPSEPRGRTPVKEPEPEVTAQATKKPISRAKPTKSPNTRTSTTGRVPKTSLWPHFRAKSYTTRSRPTKVTAKRQTLVYRTAATQPYTYGPYTTASPVYRVWNYSPTTADPRTVFYPWTTKKPPSVVPQAFYPYVAGSNAQGNAVFSSYQPYYGAASAASAVQIGGRATNRTSEKLRSAPWIPPTRKVEVVGAPSALDPKFKLAIVSNYENFNETMGTFGFDIDLENGITVQIRGYKKNGTQILDGSFSLFTEEGEPVRIAYTADDEQEMSIRSTTRGPDSKVPTEDDDDGENSTTENADDDVAMTTTTPTAEILDS